MLSIQSRRTWALHVRTAITRCGQWAAAISNQVATNAYENASSLTADRIAGRQLAEPPWITGRERAICDPTSKLQDEAAQDPN